MTDTADQAKDERHECAEGQGGVAEVPVEAAGRFPPLLARLAATPPESNERRELTARFVDELFALDRESGRPMEADLLLDVLEHDPQESDPQEIRDIRRRIFGDKDAGFTRGETRKRLLELFWSTRRSDRRLEDRARRNDRLKGAEANRTAADERGLRAWKQVQFEVRDAERSGRTITLERAYDVARNSFREKNPGEKRLLSKSRFKALARRGRKLAESGQGNGPTS